MAGAYPQVLNVEAHRMAEDAIFVHIEVKVSNSRSDVTYSYQVSGNRLLVTVKQKAAGGMGTQTTGKKQFNFKVGENEVDINTIDYVDVYGGEGSSMRATLG